MFVHFWSNQSMVKTQNVKYSWLVWARQLFSAPNQTKKYYFRLNTTVENVVEELQTRVIITDNSRRNPGMYLTTSTPYNSRSPSNSNRDSLISTDSGPPMLPMKRGGDSNDNHSLSNFDANSNASGSREDICSVKGLGRYSMKKPPPPPPPVNVNGSTPPMPRRKPPFRSPTDWIFKFLVTFLMFFWWLLLIFYLNFFTGVYNPKISFCEWHSHERFFLP